MKKRASSRSRSQDRARVSKEGHEISYAAGAIKTRGKRPQARKAAVLIAKHKLGRTTSRGEVMAEANAIANTPTNLTRRRQRAGGRSKPQPTSKISAGVKKTFTKRLRKVIGPRNPDPKDGDSH